MPRLFQAPAAQLALAQLMSAQYRRLGQVPLDGVSTPPAGTPWAAPGHWHSCSRPSTPRPGPWLRPQKRNDGVVCIEAEPVTPFGTTSYAFALMSASGDGSLIQATIRSFGGVGRWWWNRAGLAPDSRA